MSDGTSSADRIAALGALYGADRQDSSTLVTARLALLALQLTYMGLVALALNSQDPGVGPWVAAFSPFPLWFLHAYHLILVAISMARVKSVRVLEDALYEQSGLPAELRPLVGGRAGERMADIALQPVAIRIQTVVSYAGIGAVMIAFSVYALVVAGQRDGWLAVVLAGLLYLFLFGSVAVAWLHVVRQPRSPGE
ncbi:hypothetical protein [Actinophytocola sediminis]